MTKKLCKIRSLRKEEKQKEAEEKAKAAEKKQNPEADDEQIES